jgi:hypothetical protein
MMHIIAKTAVLVGALVSAIATARADDWKPGFSASDKQGQWQEVVSLATRAFAEKSSENTAPNQIQAQQNRLLLFYRTASLVNLWRTLYFKDGADHPTGDYIFVIFSEGLYYEYANNLSDARLWYAATDNALKSLQPGDVPMYDGQPIAQLVKDREDEVVAMTNSLPRAAPPSRMHETPPPPVIPGLIINGYQINDLSSVAQQQQWMSLSAQRPNLFAPTAGDMTKLHLDAHLATTHGGA